MARTPELFGAATYAAKQLPEDIAPALSLEDRELHDGKVTQSEIMVIPFLAPDAVNGKDLELIVVAHDFPERVANVDERREMIERGMRRLLGQNICDSTIGVCLILVPMSYGEFKIK